MTIQEFYNLVELMRKAQKEYFKTRSSLWLQKSIKYEKEVDNEIGRYNKEFFSEGELTFKEE